MLGIIFANTRAMKLEEAYKDASLVRGVITVKKILGRYDLVMLANAKSIEELGELILKVNKSVNILSTDTLIPFYSIGEVIKDFSALISIRLEKPSEGMAIAESILKIDGVRSAHLVFGFTDMVVFLTNRNVEKIGKIAKEVNATAGVWSSETFTVID